MFRRDLNQFRFEQNPPGFMGQGPPGPHEHPYPPPFGGPPGFRPMPSFAVPHPNPPLPMGRESFQEIRDYMLLLIISEYPNGITGYQLQDIYKFPRGTLIRALQDLEEKDFLTTREEIVDGRANKFYVITDQGKKYSEELKMKWANIFGMMAEINPPHGMKIMLMEKIEELETKDEAIDFFGGIRSWMEEMLQKIEERITKFKNSKTDLTKIIEEIEKMDNLNKEKIKEMITESINKMEVEHNNV